ncbi:DNA polymerase kappa-like [Penaeus japonicus]|uniref:DNA polymerase kappa-like n=1 Tax=Penaeus japonicus TaxID=27405 RepID=UPI001C712282|nr:DNA polymerase kappa-like [Penaeus japonicus]
MAEQTSKAAKGSDLPGTSSGPQNLALNTHKAGMEVHFDVQIISSRGLISLLKSTLHFRDKPMAVGSTGMLSTSNYAARKYGVRAAMPGFIGKKLCPDLVIVKPDYTKYKQASKEIQEIFALYDPNFCPMSLDEAYLDITEYLVKNAHIFDMEDVEDEKIHEKTKLTASAGIASNTRLAKVCSDMNKPNGQYYLPPERQRILDFISSLPIRKVSGIGNVMEQQLSAVGVNICSDLMEKRGLLKLLFSDINYNNFLNIALGLGHTTLSTWTEKDRKSISTETTFRGTADRNELFTITKDLCHELADDMAQKDIFGKVFTLKYKTIDFQIKSRAHTFPDAVRSAEVMATTAKRILQHEMDASPQPLSLRLIGVRMSNLLSSSEVGPNRQSTLTQLFSNNNASSASKHCFEDKTSIHSQKNKGENLQFVEYKEESVKQAHQSSSVESANKKTVTNQGLKNASIGQYLSKTQKAKSPVKKVSYECPVCEHSVEVASLEEFNKHVDLCLLQASSADVQSVEDKKKILNNNKRDTEETCNSENENLRHSLQETIHRTQGSSTTAEPSHSNFMGIYTFSDYESDGELESFEDFESPSSGFKRKSSDRQEEEEMLSKAECKLSCPICEKQWFENITALNEHVDECLSKSAINELLQEGTSQTSQLKQNNPQQPKPSCKRKGSSIDKQAKKIKAENNTIDRFFSS